MLGVDLARLRSPAAHQAATADYELWPEHEDAWRCYLGASSQWRIAFGWGGAVWLGLDYDGVERVMRRYGVPADQQDEVFMQIQILEDEERVLRNA